MIEFKTGDILAENVEAQVNTVNCVGMMGRGIALQFKNVWPANFRSYKAACERHEVQPGRMFVFETGSSANPRYIINFPTKRHWRGKSRIEDIESGLQALLAEVRNRNIRSIGIPPLGSGLGGLDWRDVRPRIEKAFAGLDDVRVVIFEREGSAPPDRNQGARSVPAMTAGRAALVELMDRRVAELVSGFESSFGLELLATVHWVMTRENATSETAVIRSTYEWGARKRQFSEHQIRLARRVLIDRGWVAGSEDERRAGRLTHPRFPRH